MVIDGDGRVWRKKSKAKGNNEGNGSPWQIGPSAARLALASPSAIDHYAIIIVHVASVILVASCL